MAVRRLKGGTQASLNGLRLKLKSPAVLTPTHLRNEPIVGEDLSLHGKDTTYQVGMAELEVTLDPANGVTSEVLSNPPANSVLTVDMPDGEGVFELTDATFQTGNEISTDGISASFSYFGTDGRLI